MIRARSRHSLICLVCLGLVGSAAARAAEVAINPAVKHQAILGWSVNPSAPWIARAQRDAVLDEAVNELGLTRVRWQAPNGNRASMRRWEWLNDDGDPDHVNWAALNTGDADRDIKTWVVPFKERVEARGDRFDLWISPSFFVGGSTGDAPAWLLESPGEYAEFATSFLLHLKKVHGVDANYHVVCNEPGNNNRFRPQVVGRMIRTLGPKMEALGLTTRIQFPDGINAKASWRYIQFVGNDPRVWRHVGVLSYHHYGPVDPFRRQMRDLGAAKGMPNAQTEHMGRKFPRLYDDLTKGGTSFWSIYGWGGAIKIHHDGASFSRGRDYWPLRQVMHYVRPGAVRIDAKSNDASLRALAFTRKNAVTTVLLNDGRGARRQEATVTGLPAGTYGVCQSVRGRVYEELGVRTVAREGSLKVQLVPGAVLTVYPHPGGNLAPTVTQWAARPSYLTRPARSVTLIAGAADPEKDAVSFAWSVKEQPDGAGVALADPNTASTKATGLTVAGTYAFELSVRDAAHVVRRVVRLQVFAGNQPPRTFDLHNRIPVMVTLPHSQTLLRAWPHDLEGDKLTTRWSIVRQPKGANVVLARPPRARGNTARLATGLTVAGDYVFRFHASDGAHDVHKDLAVPVYPVNRPPVIARARAGPVAGGKTVLSAKTGDPDNDTVTHWWWVKRAPKGARPVFTKQGAATTEVAGLTVPGQYVFVISAIDRTKHTSHEVRLSVR